jgi:hypothetical protein
MNDNIDNIDPALLHWRANMDRALRNIGLESPTFVGLDSYRDNSNGEKCPNKVLLHLEHKSDIGREKVVLVPCMSWSCPICRRQKANIIREKIRKLFIDRSVWMITLTSHHYYSPEIQLAWLVKKWNLYLTHIRKKHVQKVHFFRVVEEHHRGFFHLHVLIDVDMTSKRWKKLAIKCGFGFEFKCDYVGRDHGAYYASKYITKSCYDDSKGISFFRQYGRRFYSFSEVVDTEKKPPCWVILERLLNPFFQARYLTAMREFVAIKQLEDFQSVEILIDSPDEFDFCIKQTRHHKRLALDEPPAEQVLFPESLFL